MLKFSVKPTGNLGLQEIQCYSINVSPDLSYISGRTSYYNSLLNGETVKVINNKNKFTNVCKINTENVKVQGKVKLERTLPIKTIKKEVLLPKGTTYSTTPVTLKYVEYNGVCSYGYNGVYIIDGKLYTKNDDNSITITTYEYVEDGFVNIDGDEYVVNFKKNNINDDEYIEPEIKSNKDAKVLTVGTYISKNVKYLGIEDYKPSKWYKDTKFFIYKEENDELVVDDVLFGAYEHYITYNGENYYLQNLYDEDSNFIGFGVYIDGSYYTGFSRQIYEAEGDVNYNTDEEFLGSSLEIDGEEYEINNSLVSIKNNGEFVLLITKSEKLDVREGDVIIAKSNGPIRNVIDVKSDNDDEYSDKKYITYLGKRYDVVKDSYKYIIVSDTDFRLIEEDGDDYDAYAVINGKKIYYTINNGRAIPTNKIYYNFGTDEDVDVKYGIYQEGYEVISCSGVTIGENVYRVYDEESVRVVPNDVTTGYELHNQYVIISEDLSYNLKIVDKNGSKTYVCYPDIEDYGIYEDKDIDAIRRYISDVVVRFKESFTFYVRNDIFGEKPIVPESYFQEAQKASKPTTSAEKLNLSIFKVNSYLNFKLPLVGATENDISRDDIIKNDFSNSIKAKKLTDVVDMEKDIYYPAWFDGENYNQILNLRFNLHFRTRQLDNWKIIEDYAEETDKSMTNWFITDYKYYKNAILKEQAFPNEPHTVHNASDLIGYMNFTLSEVRNKAKKIGKSFLRLSFYSTNNPHTQVLLGTSTVFMDEAFLCKKMLSFQKSANAGTFIKTQAYQNLEFNSSSDKDNSSLYKTDSITVDSEYDDDGKYDFSATTTARLSSCLNVYDKNITNGSSEGFYFYMFREYANNLRPLTIFLKIEFNHAGIGRTIPFMLPRKSDGTPLYIHKKEDLKILKNGFKLKDIYKQLYIPINVIYDEKTSKYVYYLPDELRENKELGVSDDVMEFNLFEVKFKDESVVERNEDN